MMISSSSPLRTGEIGCRFALPTGTPVDVDASGSSRERLDLVDRERDVSWSIRFFDNLHMDLQESSRCHLEAGIQKQVKALFEEEFWRNFHTNTTSMKPLTLEDPNWTPVIGIEYPEIRDVSGHFCPSMIVIYRKAYRPGEQIIVGRFCLPVRHGLFEVLIEAQDKGTAWREASVVADLCSERLLTTDLLRTMLKRHPFDDAEYDDQFPTHCLSRVRRALQWFITESGLVVTEPPAPSSRSKPTSSGITLGHLGCTIRPPQRFMFCPNLLNPESNKQRFYRATLGSDDVRMLVVSVWHTHSYAPNLRKRGKESLRQIALHGAQLIHRSQNFGRIRVTVEDVPVNRRTTWRGASSGRDAIITVVDCEENSGLPCQNTIGWTRDDHSDLIHLIYCAGTLGVNHMEARSELIECLLSVRRVSNGSSYVSGRRRSSQSIWNVDVDTAQLPETTPSS